MMTMKNRFSKAAKTKVELENQMRDAMAETARQQQDLNAPRTVEELKQELAHEIRKRRILELHAQELQNTCRVQPLPSEQDEHPVDPQEVIARAMQFLESQGFLVIPLAFFAEHGLVKANAPVDRHEPFTQYVRDEIDRRTVPKGVDQERIVSISDAADHLGISVQSVRRNYKKHIIQLTERRQGIRLKDVLAVTPVRREASPGPAVVMKPPAWSTIERRSRPIVRIGMYDAVDAQQRWPAAYARRTKTDDDVHIK